MRVRILIVEDEQIIAADLAGKLTKMGHEVVGIAMEGDEAIAMAAEVLPELVLMDIQLEGKMSGIDAARTIQQRTGAHIVFVTAFPGFFLKDPAQMGVPGICVAKPFSRTQLEAAVIAAFGDSAPQ